MATTVWSIPWRACKKYYIEFKTDVDGEYTAHEQRNALKTKPAQGWTLRVPKNKANFLALRDHFIGQKGKWRAFQWKWDSLIDPAGDDVLYNVRIDIDRLEFDADEHFWQVPIVQVMTLE